MAACPKLNFADEPELNGTAQKLIGEKLKLLKAEE